MSAERTGNPGDAPPLTSPRGLPPPTGRVYAHPQRVGAADVDAAGGAHPYALARWVQEAAAADAHDSGLAPGSFWIIRRTTIRARRMPRFDEDLELRTWCSGAAKSIAERSTEVRGSLGADVDVEAIWVHVDPRSRRPARLPSEFRATYMPDGGGRRPRGSLRHPPAPPAGAERLTWTFAAADVDLAGHITNIAYWRLAEGCLAPPHGDPCLLEAEYRAGIGAGTAAVHRSGSMLWVGDPGPGLAATLRVAELTEAGEG